MLLHREPSKQNGVDGYTNSKFKATLDRNHYCVIKRFSDDLSSTARATISWHVLVNLIGCWLRVLQWIDTIVGRIMVFSQDLELFYHLIQRHSTVQFISRRRKCQSRSWNDSLWSFFLYLKVLSFNSKIFKVACSRVCNYQRSYYLAVEFWEVLNPLSRSKTDGVNTGNHWVL
jgi:hypothetical protein